MICANKPRIQMVDDFLTEGGYLFKKSIHSDDECMFLIYEDAVNQAVLLFELTINDNTTNVEMLCSVVAFFPRFNLEKVINECEKLSFIHHPFEFYVVDESVNSVCEFEVKTNKDFITEVLVKLHLMKEAIDSSLINLNYVIFNGGTVKCASGKE